MKKTRASDSLIPRSTLYSLFMQAPAIIAVLRGPDHIFELVNPGYQKLLGDRKLLGKPAREALSDIDEQWFERLDRVFETGEPYVGREASMIVDGEEHFFNFIYQPMYADERRIEGVIVFAFDVTPEVRARRSGDERLRENETIFQLLVESVRDYAIFMLDPAGRVASWNPGARRIKGYEPEEIIGRHFSIFYPQEDVRAGKPERELVAAREHGSVEDEGWRVRKDGTKFWANVVITAVRDSDGNLRGFAKVTRDITERRKAEETERALHVSQETSSAKDEFIAVVSHELRTPLTSILGWARMLRIGGLDAATTEEALNALERSAQAQVHLIEDLLDDARITAGKVRLLKRSLEMKPVIEAAVTDLTPAAENKKIRIETQLDESIPIVGDPTRLQQVITNILSNAIKFTPQGGNIVVRLEAAGSIAQIEIRDTGAGIATDLLPHIFERFRQGDPASKDRKGGLGLGLSIARHLVELHGGDINASSDGIGKGATFTIRLPMAPKPSDEFIARDRNRDEDLPDLRGVRVLIVEDETDNREVFSAVVGRCGGQARASRNAEEALDILRDWQPDAIVCDIALPGMDGCEFLKKVRLRLQTPALALTVLGSQEEQIRMTACGFQIFRQKPIEPADLAHDIERLAKSSGATLASEQTP